MTEVQLKVSLPRLTARKKAWIMKAYKCRKEIEKLTKLQDIYSKKAEYYEGRIQYTRQMVKRKVENKKAQEKKGYIPITQKAVTMFNRIYGQHTRWNVCQLMPDNVKEATRNKVTSVYTIKIGRKASVVTVINGRVESVK